MKIKRHLIKHQKCNVYCLDGCYTLCTDFVKEYFPAVGTPKYITVTVSNQAFKGSRMLNITRTIYDIVITDNGEFETLFTMATEVLSQWFLREAGSSRPIWILIEKC